MKIIIFAGGHGTRFWPLSRKNFPKQFEKIFEGKSTLQLAVDRVSDIFGTENIYISTNEKFKDIVRDQVPFIPIENYILEPHRKDLAAAIAFSLLKIKENGYTGAISILWSDHLMKNVEEFQKALTVGEQLINENPNRFVFMGEKPRFPNHNLGWITVNEQLEKRNDLKLFSFKNWVYKPDIESCKIMFASGKSYWNPGYFVTSTDFLTYLYQKHLNSMFQKLESAFYNKNLEETYKNLDSITFDDAIVKKIDEKEAVVIEVDLGWSDPGTLYALKEALQENPESNVIKGNVFDLRSKDSLIFNTDVEKLVATIGLDGMVIVNLSDALIVVHKNNVPEITELVEKLKKEGYERYV